MLEKIFGTEYNCSVISGVTLLIHPLISQRPPSPPPLAMPVPLRAVHHRGEAKHNVTTDCKSFPPFCQLVPLVLAPSSKSRSPFCGFHRQRGSCRICPLAGPTSQLCRRWRPPSPCCVCRGQCTGCQTPYRVWCRCECPKVSFSLYRPCSIPATFLFDSIPTPPYCSTQAFKALFQQRRLRAHHWYYGLNSPPLCRRQR
jgi:hypothetical protein